VKRALIGAALLLAMPCEARAQDVVLARGRNRFASPQHFAVELRFAPYWPNIDSEPALKGARPYHDSFGDHPWARLLAAFEFDWQVLRIPHIGTIGPAASLGYTQMSAPALKVDGTCCSPANTNLEVIPFYTVAVLRVDAFMRDLSIPVVPYVKAGLGYAFWRTWDDGSGTSKVNGIAGSGFSVGPHLAAGVALQLNVFDQGAARALDESTGINNTYAYFEGMWSGVGELGGSMLRVGTTTWVVGLAMEF
jgi:hypothetical protein